MMSLPVAKKNFDVHLLPFWKWKVDSYGFKGILMYQPACLAIVGLSKDVFERRTSTGSELFSLFICLNTNKFVLLSFFFSFKDDLLESLIQTTDQ